MAQEVDEFGIPIRKQQDGEQVDEFGIPIKKKEPGELKSGNTSPVSTPLSGKSNSPSESLPNSKPGSGVLLSDNANIQGVPDFSTQEIQGLRPKQQPLSKKQQAEKNILGQGTIHEMPKETPQPANPYAVDIKAKSDNTKTQIDQQAQVQKDIQTGELERRNPTTYIGASDLYGKKAQEVTGKSDTRGLIEYGKTIGVNDDMNERLPDYDKKIWSNNEKLQDLYAQLEIATKSGNQQNVKDIQKQISEGEKINSSLLVTRNKDIDAQILSLRKQLDTGMKPVQQDTPSAQSMYSTGIGIPQTTLVPITSEEKSQLQQQIKTLEKRKGAYIEDVANPQMVFAELQPKIKLYEDKNIIPKDASNLDKMRIYYGIKLTQLRKLKEQSEKENSSVLFQDNPILAGMGVSTKEVGKEVIKSVKQRVPFVDNKTTKAIKEIEGELDAIAPIVALNLDPNIKQSGFWKTFGNKLVDGISQTTQNNTRQESAGFIQQATQNAGVPLTDLRQQELQQQSAGKDAGQRSEKLAGGLADTAGFALDFAVTMPIAGGILNTGTKVLQAVAPRVRAGVGMIETALNQTKLGRLVTNMTDDALKYEVSGRLNKTIEEDATLSQGALGALGSKLGEKVIKPISNIFGGRAGEFLDLVGDTFGRSFVELTEEVSQNTGQLVNEVSGKKSFIKGVVELFKDSAKGREFTEGLKAQYGELDDNVDFAIQIFAMSAAFNVGKWRKFFYDLAFKQREKLTPTGQEQFDAITNELESEVKEATSQAVADMAQKEGVTVDEVVQGIEQAETGQQPQPNQDQEQPQVGQPAISINSTYTVNDMLDRVGSFDGKRGSFELDGQTVVFKEYGSNRDYEIGNVDEVGSKPISELGIAYESSEVSVNDTGNIVVRGKEYTVNNYSNQTAAINRDTDGNIISVTLDTMDGQKRTFRGNTADDVALQITLKKLENEKRQQEFEDFINTDEESIAEINNARFQEPSAESTTTATAKVPKPQVGQPANSVIGTATAKPGSSIITQTKVAISNKLAKGEELTGDEKDFYGNFKEEIDGMASSVNRQGQQAELPLPNQPVTKLTPEQRKEVAKEVDKATLIQKTKEGTLNDYLLELYNQKQQQQNEVQVAPNRPADEGQEQNVGAGVQQGKQDGAGVQPTGEVRQAMPDQAEVPEQVQGQAVTPQMSNQSTPTQDMSKNEGKIDNPKPIRQLGTGANVYFETSKYRVSDSRNGNVFLNIGNEFDEVPLRTVEFDNVNEAVFIAQKLQESRPDGLTNEYNIDAVIETLKGEYNDSRTPNKANQPVQQDAATSEQQGNQEAVQQSPDATGQGNAETPVAILGENNQENIKLAEDENEQQLAERKLTNQDNVEQEPNVKAIEGKAESNNEVELNEAVRQADELINTATDVVNVPVADISVNTEEYQGRKNRFSERSANNVANNFDKNKFDPIVVYKHPDGKTYVLSGHSRLEGMKRRGEATIPARYFEGTPEQAKEFALKSNKLGTLQTDIENASYYREQIKAGKSYNAVLEEAKANEQQGSAKKIVSMAHLNPDGKTMKALEALEGTEGDSNSNLVTIATKIGDIRAKNEHLTDAHEDELFDYMVSDRDNIPTDKEIADQNSQINRSINSVRFNPSEPLNLQKFTNKSNARIQWESEKKDLESQVSELKKEVNPSKKTGWTGLKEKAIASIAKSNSKEDLDKAERDFENDVNGIKTNYQKLLERKRAELLAVSNKLAKHLLAEKNLIEGEKNQQTLFQSSKKPFATITKKAFDNLITRLKKAFPNVKVFQDEKTLKEKLKEYGVDVTDFLFGYEGAMVTSELELQQLERARNMKANGSSMPEIRKETGWFIGLDGKWKYIIDDTNADFSISEDEMRKLSTGTTPDYNKGIPFEQVFNHNEFVKKFPDIAKRIKFVFYEDTSENKQDIGGTVKVDSKSGTATIAINTNYVGGNPYFGEAGSLREVTIHEIQHTIQGFKPDRGIISVAGTSVQHIKYLLDNNLLKIQKPNGSFFDYSKFNDDRKNALAVFLYESNADEIEARAAMLNNDINSALGNLLENVYYIEFESNPFQYNLISTPKVQFLRTQNGTIYGAKFPDGSIYINPDNLNANTPIHEFGHIWEQAFGVRFNRGVELIKQSKAGRDLIEELRKNPAYKNYSDNQLEREALVTMIGNKGEQLVGTPIYQKFLDWMKDLFKAVADKLGVRSLTADERLDKFTKEVVGELLGGKVLNEEIGRGAKGDIDFQMDEAIKQSKDIKLVKDKDGNLLAPNGKKSNLNETQWKIVRTDAFKNWFGDWEGDAKNASKVVDENGEPLVVYHGTTETISEFITDHDKKNDVGWLGLGNYFSQSKKIADIYVKSKQQRYKTDSGNVYAVFLNLRNPYKATNTEKYQKNIGFSKEDAKRYTQEKIKEGYDGVYIDDYAQVNEYVSFNPNQIKLADGTNTTFNPKTKDIRFQFSKSELYNTVRDLRDSGVKDADIRDMLDLAGNTQEEIDDAMGIDQKSLDNDKQRVADRFVKGGSNFEQVREMVIQNGYDKSGYDSKQIFKDIDDLIAKFGTDNIEKLLDLPLSEPHRVVLQHKIFEHFGKMSVDETLSEHDRKEAFEKSARYLLDLSRQRTDAGRGNAILHQIYLDSDIYFTLPMAQKKMDAIGTVLSDAEMAEMKEMAQEIERLRKENKVLQESAQKEQDERIIDDIKNHLLVDELILDSRTKDEIEMKKAKQRLGENFQKIAEKFGAIKMLEATEKADFFQILHEMTKDLMTVSKIGAKKAVKTIIKSIRNQHPNIDNSLLSEAQEYILNIEKEETDIEDSNGNKISKGDLLELIEGGADTMPKLIEAIREKFYDGNKAITDKQIRDSITGYGNSIKKDKTDVEKKLSEIKSLMLIQSKLEDALNNVRPKKTGAIREKDTIEVIRLRRQLSEAMKKLTGDMSESEIAGLNERKLTYLGNRIKEVQDLINGINKDVNKKAPFEYSQAVKDKQKELDELMKQQEVLLHYTKEKLINLAARYQEKLDKKIYSKNPVLNKLTISDKEYEELKIALEEKKEQLKKERDSFRNNDSDYLLQQMQKSIDRQIERINDLLVGIDNRKKSEEIKAEKIRKQEIVYKNSDSSALEKLRENQRVLEEKKEQWERLLIKKQIEAEMANKSALRRISGNLISNLISMSRTTTLGLIDVGWIGVQGGYFMRTKPFTFARALRDSWEKGDLDEKSFMGWIKSLKEVPMYETMLKSGLRIPNQSLRQEIFEQEYRQSRFTDFLEKIPGLNLVNKNGRLSVKFLSHLRMETFLDLYNKLSDEQKQDSKTLEKLADFVNVHTGAGGIVGENKNGSLNKWWGLLTSARNTSSMLQQTYLGIIYQAAKNYDHRKGIKDQPVLFQQIKHDLFNQSVLFGTLFLSQYIARYIDNDDEDEWEIEKSPFSTNYMKLRGYGNKYFDMGGTTSLNVATLRLATMILNAFGADIDNYKTKNGYSQIGGSNWNDKTGSDIVIEAFVNRLVPFLSFVKNPLQAKKKDGNYYLFGKEYTPTEFGIKMLKDMFKPINVDVVSNDLSNEQQTKLSMIMNYLISAFGVAVQDDQGARNPSSNSKSDGRSINRSIDRGSSVRSIDRGSGR